MSRAERLTAVPITYREACAFVKRHHRHHPPARGQVFAIAAALGDLVVGVATAGRPVTLTDAEDERERRAARYLRGDGA